MKAELTKQIPKKFSECKFLQISLSKIARSVNLICHFIKSKEILPNALQLKEFQLLLPRRKGIKQLNEGII